MPGFYKIPFRKRGMSRKVSFKSSVHFVLSIVRKLPQLIFDTTKFSRVIEHDSN